MQTKKQDRRVLNQNIAAKPARNQVNGDVKAKLSCNKNDFKENVRNPSKLRPNTNKSVRRTREVSNNIIEKIEKFELKRKSIQEKCKRHQRVGDCLFCKEMPLVRRPKARATFMQVYDDRQKRENSLMKSAKSQICDKKTLDCEGSSGFLPSQETEKDSVEIFGINEETTEEVPSIERYHQDMKILKEALQTPPSLLKPSPIKRKGSELSDTESI